MRITKEDTLDFELPQDFQRKFIEKTRNFNVYKVVYAYKTMRGNKKENHKYIISNDAEEAKFEFIMDINDFNTKNPYRAISNVKILDTVLLGTVTK